MNKAILRLLILVLLLATAALVVTAAIADDDGTAEVPEQLWLIEWDGTTLHTRTVTVSSAAEREFLHAYNSMNRMLVDAATDSWQRYQGGGSPERDVIETEYGTVTVERQVTESDQSVSTPTGINVEIERVETPYGIITIEKQSSGEPVEVAVPDEGDSGGQPLGLSEYTDALYASCGSNGVEFNFGSNQTQSSYVLYWSGGSFADYVVCSASSCSFKITTSWSTNYTYGWAYTTTPGYVYGFGFDDYRCH